MESLSFARCASLLALCTTLAACHSTKHTHGTLPCSMVSEAMCGTMCKATSDCGPGLYCATNGTCSAQCNAGDSTCGTGQTCDSTGQCIATNPTGGTDASMIVCPSGLKCNVTCSGGTTTTITGKVYDPAIKNGLYNVSVYVPEAPLQPLPKGVLTGADACSCGALFQSGAVVSTSTLEDGTFELTNAPVGTSVPLVIQIGKWRRLYHLNITACGANAQPDKSLSFPSTIMAGDTDDNIPDIAVSTGSADTLECLMHRIGLPVSEYVAGTGTTGHVHVFTGGATGKNQNGGVGKQQDQPMAGAPVSSTDLWSTQAQLMPYDIVLLSCEGGETYEAQPANLESYLDAGGRVFASHFHYAWFSGPIATMGTQSYTAPMDWGTKLATWSVDGKNPPDGVDVPGVIDTVLNNSTSPFPKGVSLQKWLTDVNALGVNTTAGDLSIYSPRYNAVVGTTNTPSQAWITSNDGNKDHTMYFSFDTPVNPTTTSADGGAPQYCGRAVFSDLHVSGDPTTHDTAPTPTGCADADLSPQEKALEFMLFDLSSCVISDTVAPTTGVPIL